MLKFIMVAQVTRFMVAISPGMIMCPISSILEATHANLNPEPVHVKWRRGYAPRAVREIIFGVGLNQMSDYFAERVPQDLISSPTLRSSAGSLFAGVVSGYLSHVPHNLSTMKLMNPTKSYNTLFKEFSARRLPMVKSMKSFLSCYVFVVHIYVIIYCSIRSFSLNITNHIFADP